MVRRLLVQNLVWIVALGALLFASAGTFDWPGAWFFLAETGVGGIAVGLWLAKHDPGLLAERLSPTMQRGQKGWDKVFMACVFVLWGSWLVLMALDARFHASETPAWAPPLGAILIALCFTIVWLAFRENSFAAPVVKIQAERGHRVVTSGPYRHVRHPMYAGALLFFLGVPLLLGSWWGLAAAPLMAAVLAVRAVLEERMLIVELEGYADYAARVRYRLVPGVW
jgi:protein-S-isoprenylcysteine O-methyltransferase Ste14